MVTHILAFDVETTGPNLQTNFCPEFGAALVCVETGWPVWRFHTYCAQPAGRGWDQHTLTDFWLVKAREKYDDIVTHVTSAPLPQDAMRTFVKAVRLAVETHVPGGLKSVIIVSDTAGFDCEWMDSMMPPDAAPSMRSLLDSKVDRPLRDVSSVYFGIAGYMSSDDVPKDVETGKRPNSYELACKALGVETVKTVCEHTHNPTDDAVFIAQRAAHIERALRVKRAIKG